MSLSLKLERHLKEQDVHNLSNDIDFAGMILPLAAEICSRPFCVKSFLTFLFQLFILMTLFLDCLTFFRGVFSDSDSVEFDSEYATRLK